MNRCSTPFRNLQIELDAPLNANDCRQELQIRFASKDLTIQKYGTRFKTKSLLLYISRGSMYRRKTIKFNSQIKLFSEHTFLKIQTLIILKGLDTQGTGSQF